MDDVFKRSGKVIVTCSKRLASFLEMELEALDFDPTRVFPTGAELQGSIDDCIHLNVNLRCASQVLYSLREMTVNSPDGLYKALVSYPWEDLIPVEGYVSVTSNVNTRSINNELFVNVKVKDAIADRLRKVYGKRPDSGSLLDGVVIHLYWKDDQAEIFLDTSGHTLSKHGYRKIPGKAPMLEALATATIMATKWDARFPFINPMCGSGTVAIEAALMATGRRPGLYRNNYSFMHVRGYDPSVYRRAMNFLNERIIMPSDLKIIATDQNPDAINVSKKNAATADVEQCIHFERCEFADTDIPPGKSGVVFFNPEYGERMGQMRALEETYSRIGDFMKKKCRGYTGYVFTGNMELAKKIGLKASRRIEFYSAKIDCRLLEYELYEGSRKR